MESINKKTLAPLTDTQIHYIASNILNALKGLSVFEGIAILEIVKHSLITDRVIIED
jgi:hypothetical protein